MAISIKKSKNIEKSIKEAFKELDFKIGNRVFIKPNLSGRKPIIAGENTSIEVMDALISVLSKKGREIIIGHGQLLGSVDHETSFEETLADSGFDKYVNKKGVKVINIDNLKRRAVDIEEMKFHLPLDFLEKEIDTYINLSKIKTHMETTVSLSLKNQMGLPSRMDRVMMHKTNLERTIAKLGIYCKPDINIAEGFPAMENNGPHHGTARQLDIIVVGDDMVEMDSFISELLGYDSRLINHIKYANEIGIGVYFDVNRINEYKNYLVNDFKKASKVHMFGKNIYVYPTYACSRCINAINYAGKEFKKHPFKNIKLLFKAYFSGKKIRVVFGKADDLKLDNNGKIVCVGSCSKKFASIHEAECLDKCPPGIEETREYLTKNI